VLFIPTVLAGIPLGAYFMRHVDSETFRRICMSFDAWDRVAFTSPVATARR
jgi:uncharacterized membrane protein YfcA